MNCVQVKTKDDRLTPLDTCAIVYEPTKVANKSALSVSLGHSYPFAFKSCAVHHVQSIALLLLSLCLGNILGHRLDNYLFKPVLDFIGPEVTPVVTKTSNDEFQSPVEDSIFSELRDSDSAQSVQRRSEAGRKDLLQHLYAAYGCLSSFEGWTKSKDSIDFDALSSKGFDCKRSEPPNDDLPIQTFDQNQLQSLSDGQSNERTFSPDKSLFSGNRFLHSLPVSHVSDFYKDLLIDTNKKDSKRAGTAPVIGCDCKVKIDLLDLGQQHYPRYLMNAVCQNSQSPNQYPQKCWRGSYCKPLEYKVKVLTPRTRLEPVQNDPALAWLPDELRQAWKFKTVTVAAGCFCSY
ncbi:uncharacterized protein LOC105211856 [Zeugodacus cucurbitae]|uniref:uncharacterized protein LOC105211856 n=1 Tax=Zeugodacus cucurbitae TaxID=28588 RepID=UPI0005968C56|nr:uncharacterized protein LOC105211856 [Zeugodacus cucurbitae]